jgi:CheY-like chemotaxis protein
MNKNGPIVIIDDDADDRYLLADVFNELNYPNEIKFFDGGKEALRYLQQSDSNPFLILSDVNMPGLDGFELRKTIYQDPNLAQKCVPYLFFSTFVSEQVVKQAYLMSVQGYFVKPNTYDKLKETMRRIVEYWQECQSPQYKKDPKKHD